MKPFVHFRQFMAFGKIINKRFAIPLSRPREMLSHTCGYIDLYDLRTSEHGSVATCPIPCDHVPRRSWPYLEGREVLRGVIEAFRREQTSTKATVRKWREREDMQDRSHRPNNLATTLTPIQEMLVVELRRTLLLPLDDLLALLTNSSTLQSPVPAWTGAFGGTASGI